MKYILFVGTIQPRKNLVALIEAFAKSGLEKLVIAGGVGWGADEILRAPGEFGVQEKVIFTGRVTDSELQELYEGASLYVQPSITEGFGLPVLEAMKSGVVVVSSDGGALKEIVGAAGVIVKLKGDFVSELAKAMKRVIGDKKLQERLIAIGYERVKMFTWDIAAKQTLAVLTGEGYNLQSRKFQIPNSKF